MRRESDWAHAWQHERRQKMTLTRKDAVATGLTGLAVFVFLATHEALNVPLVGESHRWAAAVIMALGIGACSVGAKRVDSALFGVLGAAAFVFGVLALVTGSLTPLSLLVADMVVMWALTTFRHAHTPPGRTIAT
jgi:membrane-bound ClpP family serine protease